MPNPYNDVELTDSEKLSIFENPKPPGGDNPKEAGTDGKEGFGSQPHNDESQEVETEANAEVETEGANESGEGDEFNLEDYEVEIEGEKYDGNDILKWRNDSVNNGNWKAKNTQEAQKIAQWSKFTTKLSEDSEFKDYIKDYFYDNEKELTKLGLNKELSPLGIESEETVPQEEPDNKYDEVSDRLNQMEFERHVDDLEDELDTIVESNEDFFADEGSDVAFLEFAEKSGMTDLNQAFKVYAYDSMQGELDHHRKLDGNKQRNQGKVVHNSRIGATEEVAPIRRKSVKDINVNDPDIAKYFDR